MLLRQVLDCLYKLEEEAHREQETRKGISLRTGPENVGYSRTKMTGKKENKIDRLQTGC